MQEAGHVLNSFRNSILVQHSTGGHVELSVAISPSFNVFCTVTRYLLVVGLARVTALW